MSEVKCERRMWLNKRQYLAAMSNALVIVTVDENKEPVRYAIFEKGDSKCTK